MRLFISLFILLSLASCGSLKKLSTNTKQVSQRDSSTIINTGSKITEKIDTTILVPGDTISTQIDIPDTAGASDTAEVIQEIKSGNKTLTVRVNKKDKKILIDVKTKPTEVNVVKTRETTITATSESKTSGSSTSSTAEKSKKKSWHIPLSWIVFTCVTLITLLIFMFGRWKHWEAVKYFFSRLFKKPAG